MKSLFRIYVFLALLLQLPARCATAPSGAVATVHPLATDAAVAALDRGGNAVDAAVAAALTLGVVDGHNSGIGGGCFLLIHTPQGKVIAIDGREEAPARAQRDMFLRDGKVVPELSQTGPLAVGIPGSLLAYEYALEKFGNLSLADLLHPAASLAEKGFPIDDAYAARIRAEAAEIKKFPETSRLLLDSAGHPHPAGFVLKQPDLARTYRALAAQGTRWFYRGEYAKATARWMNENGGLITQKDFAAYRLRLREPVRSFYRGYEIFGFPPPSSGGVHVAQILNILENFKLSSHASSSPQSAHLVVESMKLAFADRAAFLGDPAFAKVPLGLVSTNYARTLASRISPDSVLAVTAPGPAWADDPRAFKKHTTHFSTADSSGYWVACTATVNTSFGSKVIIPGTGVFLNNQMDDFSAQPGVANYFGLVGAEANAVAPRKRPLSSMSPTIVRKNGQPILSLGAAGGPTIISQTVVNLIQIIDYGKTINEALQAPRLHHQWKPDQLRVERSLPESTRSALTALGHKITVVDSAGAAQIVSQSTNGFSAAHDPRLKGKATVWNAQRRGSESTKPRRNPR